MTKLERLADMIQMDKESFHNLYMRGLDDLSEQAVDEAHVILYGDEEESELKLKELNEMYYGRGFTRSDIERVLLQLGDIERKMI